MNQPTLYIVDVFAEEKYAGNQLAVFRHGNHLSSEDMQTIAKEMNYSETTFILSEEEKDGGYDVRIFTPAAEVPFAGHPTLGTSFIIQQEIIKKPVDKLVLNLKVGQIPVTFSYKNSKPDLLQMKQNSPVFGEIIDKEIMVKILCLDTNDFDSRFPVQEVSTGLPFFIAPIKNLAAVKKAKINLDEYFSFIENKSAKAILFFCPEPYEKNHDLNARMFADYYGVPEDPATGSANGCLAGYLVKHKYFGKTSFNIQVEQGYEIGRKSLLYLKGNEQDGQINVFVGGKVFMVAKGELV